MRHGSDCALHNAPALPLEKCDCDARLKKHLRVAFAAALLLLLFAVFASANLGRGAEFHGDDGALVEPPPSLAGLLQECYPRKVFLAKWKETYHEVTAVRGVAGEGTGYMRVLVSPEGRWTLTVEGAKSGLVCALASGYEWIEKKNR